MSTAAKWARVKFCNNLLSIINLSTRYSECVCAFKNYLINFDVKNQDYSNDLSD